MVFNTILGFCIRGGEGALFPGIRKLYLGDTEGYSPEGCKNSAVR